jgi:predicted flap endonuclease-1-like 5' DNA nuclease
MPELTVTVIRLPAIQFSEHVPGPIYATRLRESGVGTFADLAQLTPERIVEIVLRDREASESLFDAEDWKRQARILAEEHENEPRG